MKYVHVGGYRFDNTACLVFEHVIYQLERKYQSSTNETQSTGGTKVIHLSETKQQTSSTNIRDRVMVGVGLLF